MRLILPLTLALLASCQREAPAPPAPPTSNLETLVHLCQEKTHANYTYGEATAALLRQHAFELGTNAPDTSEKWTELLRATLAEQGLEIARIGPERIDVWVIRRKGS